MDNAKIAAAFVKAQKHFAPALKTNTNPAFRSKYVALDGCIEAVIDALNANGIALLQPTHDCETGVTVETIFLHESGEILSGGRLHLPAVKQDAQGYGSALTYARRYSLMAACGIAPEDDDGQAATKASQAPRHRPMPDNPLAELPKDEQDSLRDLAMEVIALVQDKRPVDAVMAVRKQNLEGEQKIALWSLLDAPTRSAFKLAEKSPQLQTETA